MGAKREFTTEEARQIGERIGVNWDEYDIEEFRMGLSVELEHGLHDGQTNVTDDDELITGKIALAHLKEIRDYYSRLAVMERDAEAYWDSVRD
ncbi:MAG: hypothetical protein KBG73_06120 [Candidatus Promineofilum sp.]|nr:hypothetical protein [Promineifilum sp.]